MHVPQSYELLVLIIADTIIGHETDIPECVRTIHDTMNSCFAKFNMKPDMFLVNITHNRQQFLGDLTMAKSLCQ